LPRQHPSANHTARRDGLQPELVVLHFTAMASCKAALQRLCAPEHEVSAHYLIGRDGGIFQLVDEARRAWHAGAGSWGGQRDVNSRSIGIELDNDGVTPFSAPQMARLEAVLPGILTRWNIPAKGVIGHSDMAPLRKADPGRRFDWRRLALQGLAVWPENDRRSWPARAPDAQAFHTAAVRFGYPAEHSAEVLLEVFRQRFRPWAFGPLAVEDMAVIARLAADFSAGGGQTRR